MNDKANVPSANVPSAGATSKIIQQHTPKMELAEGYPLIPSTAQNQQHIQPMPPMQRPPAPAFMPGGPIDQIAKAISSVMLEIGVVAKEGNNKFFGYRYATIGGVLEKLTPLLGKHGLMITQNEVERKFDERHVAVTYAFRIAHSSGQVWPDVMHKTGMALARDSKGSWDDKCLNKASTAARKYFLLELFQIPTGEEEADAGGPGPQERSAERGVPPVQQRPPSPPPPSAVDESKPHRLVLGKGAGAEEWAQTFIRVIGKATTAAEVNDWLAHNGHTMKALARDHRSVEERVSAAVLTRLEQLSPKKVSQTPPLPRSIASNGPVASDVGALADEFDDRENLAGKGKVRKVVSPPDESAMPDPVDDPDGAIQFIANYIVKLKSQEDLEGWWNDVVAPLEEKFFPPDWQVLIKEFERAEARLKS